MQEALVRIGLVVFYLFLVASLLLTVIGLPGNWILVSVALVATLIPWFEMSWIWFIVIAALAVLGEIIESALGVVVVARKGGTRWGVLGSFVGGIAGVILGSPLVPPFGALLFGFVGAFAGAVLGEYYRSRHVEGSLRVGGWSFVGRALAIMGKVAAGVGIVWIVVSQTWR